MNERGQYGRHSTNRGGGFGGARGYGQPTLLVGAQLQHVLELSQRYDGVNAAGAQALLNGLATDGVISSIGTNRWEVALKDGNNAWVRLDWNSGTSVLQVTITDKQPHPIDQVRWIRNNLEKILREKITPRLTTYGAVAVGSTEVGELWHTVGDREAALRYLKEGANTTYQELTQQILHATPEHPYGLASDTTIRPDWLTWWKYRAEPLFANFRNWAAARSPESWSRFGGYVAYGEQFKTDWTAYEQWADQLNRLRREAEELGIQFRASLPAMKFSTIGTDASVGITLYHSVGDRADAVKQMAVDWDALYQNLASAVGEIPYDMSQVDWSKRPPAVQKAREEEVAAWKAIDAAPAAQKAAATKRAQELSARRGQLYLESFDPKKVAWWKSYASPLIKEWAKFKSDQLGNRTVASDYIAFAERWQTNWDVYEDWKKKLDNLRAEAQKQGFAIDVPAATELPTTVWADVEHAFEKGAGKIASGAGDVWTFLKYGAWAVLGLGAIVAISSVASNIKSGKDPGEKYMELIRQSRRPRAPRAARAALPASEQLALAAGEEG